MDGEPARCSLCGVDQASSRHHLIPRTVHTNKWFKKTYTRDEMHRTIPVCVGCHETINTLDAKELGKNYNTPEKLLEHPQVAKFVAWKRRKEA